MYSPRTSFGHGQAFFTFEDSPRGYYMCWYVRDRILEWYRDFAPDEAQTLARTAGGHAPDAARTWYYYRVAFVDQGGSPGIHIGGGQFGVPLVDSDRFPGWARASASYSAMRAASMAMEPIPVQWGLL